MGGIDTNIAFYVLAPQGDCCFIFEDRWFDLVIFLNSLIFPTLSFTLPVAIFATLNLTQNFSKTYHFSNGVHGVHVQTLRSPLAF